MKYLIKISCTFALCFLSVYSLQAQQTSNKNTKNVLSLSSSDIKQLYEGEALTNISQKHDKERLLYTPDVKLFSELDSYVKKQKPSILYESLYFLPTESKADQDALFLRISNLLRDVPILADIEYTNQKDGNIHPVFKSSKVITDIDDTKKKEPLPSLSTVPQKKENDTIYVLQDMPPFGDVISRYRYTYDKDYAQFIGNNTSPIKYSSITAVRENRMFTGAWLIKTKDGLLLYGVGAVKTSGVASFFSNVIENSFSSRMIGLFEWLNEELMKPIEKK